MILLHIKSCFLILLTGLVGAIASPIQTLVPPTVILDGATVTGITSGSTNRFLGIPYAKPPTGDLRFRLPQSLPPYSSSFSATVYGPACPQQAVDLPVGSGLPAEVIDVIVSGFYDVTPYAEDCLTVNVVAPDGATPGSNLPVVVWLFGGGFEFGGTAKYDGSAIVEKSISLGVASIFVSMNYRLNAFGFLASKEVKDAGVGNLGLQDQRLALHWVQKYICAFGGDPSKVTIWGQSAGAMSVALHMVTNEGNHEGLFRAAFMQSGSPISVGDITHGQPYYDTLVEETGCSGAHDTLQCLREVPYETLLHAANEAPGVLSYQSLDLAWLPRVDGVFLTEDPQHSVQRGSIADVPFISGECDDEGTLFSLSTLNITTTAQLEEYLKAYWMRKASTKKVAELMKYYPSDAAEGAPFDTGDRNALTPQFKRIAAIQGDIAFKAPRRFFLQTRSGKQNIWTYVSKRMKWVPFLGSFHVSDLNILWSGADIASYLVRFVANLDPNVGESTDLYWPQYDAATNKTMLEFLDGSTPLALTTDTYRAEAIEYAIKTMLANSM